MSQRPTLGIDARRRRTSRREQLTGALPPLATGHAEIYAARAQSAEPLCTSRGPGACICKEPRLHDCVRSRSVNGPMVLTFEPDAYHSCACGETWPVKVAA